MITCAIYIVGRSNSKRRSSTQLAQVMCVKLPLEKFKYVFVNQQLLFKK
jgi:hypothetical protein